MYTLITAVLKKRNEVSGFVELDVKSMTLTQLLNDYAQGYLVLSNPYLTGELFLSLDQIRASNLGLASYNTSVGNWLISNGNKTLPYSSTEPQYTYTKPYYVDGHYSGFKSSAVHPVATITDYPKATLTDLYIHKETVDSMLLHENTLVMVNGYMHTHTPYKQGIKISDGVKSVNVAKTYQLGVLSFQDCGGVEMVNFDPSMLSKSTDEVALYRECIINLDQDISGKSIMLSIAGHLIYDPRHYRIIDPVNGYIALNLSQINLIDKIQKAVNFLEFPELLQVFGGDILKNISLDVIESDVFIMSLLRMTQSFAIIVNQPAYSVTKSPIFYQGVKGRYFTNEFGYDIITDEIGRFVPYFYYGNQPHPLFPDKHIIHVPKEYVERTVNLRNTSDWRYRNNSYEAPSPTMSNPTDCQRFELEFYKPA